MNPEHLANPPVPRERTPHSLHIQDLLPKTVHDRVLCTIMYHLGTRLEDTDMREKLLDLANLAYERELSRELSRVQRHVNLYREKESKFFNLQDIKLKFYREASDEVWRLYDRLEPDKAVERAIALGLLTNDEISEDIQNALQHAAQYVS